MVKNVYTPPPSRALSFCVGSVISLLYLCDPLLFSLFLPILLTFVLGQSVSVVFVSIVSSLTHQLDNGLLVSVCSLIFLSLPSYCLIAFCLVFLWRPDVGPSAGHIIRLTIPANSYLVLATRPGP